MGLILVCQEIHKIIYLIKLLKQSEQLQRTRDRLRSATLNYGKRSVRECLHIKIRAFRWTLGSMKDVLEIQATFRNSLKFSQSVKNAQGEKATEMPHLQGRRDLRQVQPNSFFNSTEHFHLT